MRRMINFRLSDEQIKGLKDIAERMNCSTTKIMELTVTYIIENPDIVQQLYLRELKEQQEHVSKAYTKKKYRKKII